MGEYKMKKTSEEVRQDLLAKIKIVQAKIAEEKKAKFYSLGKIITQYVDGEITAKVMKTEVKKITGKELPSEQTNNMIEITDNEIDEALK